MRARICVERGRFWQAEYWVSGVRDQALALACLRRGLPSAHGRGYDALPAEVTAPLAGALVRRPARGELLRALGAALEGLLREAREAEGARELAARIEVPLTDLVSARWPEG